MAGRLLVLIVGVGFGAGCASSGETNYRASAALAEQDWGDRLHLEVEGVRLLAGPPAVFPYRRELGEGRWERGQYQLFTRVMVENVGRSPIVVHWGRARLVGPGGEVVPLLDTRWVARRVEGAEPAPRDASEELEPGERSVRAMIPETLVRIDVDEPMVPLCDGCEFRLIVPVEVEAREERLTLVFRLVEERAAERDRRGPRRDPDA